MRAIGLVLLLAACSAGGGENEAVQATPEAQAGTAAQRIMAGVPTSLGGGVEITGAKAEGRTLVVALNGMTDWRPDYTDAAMATTMKRGICFQPGVDALTKAGGRVRLESRTAAGQNLPPLTITAC